MNGKEPEIPPTPHFGRVALELGYITPGQLNEALDEQREDDRAGRARLPIGSILYGKGWITLRQFEMVFNRRLEVVRALRQRREP